MCGYKQKYSSEYIKGYSKPKNRSLLEANDKSVTLSKLSYMTKLIKILVFIRAHVLTQFQSQIWNKLVSDAGPYKNHQYLH